MKRLILGFVLSLSISTLFACHIDTLGWCGGKTFLRAVDFGNNAEFQFRIYGTTDILFTYTTKPTGSTDTVFVLPQSIQGYPIRLQFRIKYVGADFTQWGGDYEIPDTYVQSATHQLAGCGVLAVQFTDISAVKEGDNVEISFNNQDEQGVIRYDIMMSTDSKEWDKATSIDATGQHSYSVRLGGIAAAFMLPLFAFFKRKKLTPMLWLSILLVVVLFSCQKEKLTNAQKSKYNYVRVDAISADGNITHSQIKRF